MRRSEYNILRRSQLGMAHLEGLRLPELLGGQKNPDKYVMDSLNKSQIPARAQDQQVGKPNHVGVEKKSPSILGNTVGSV
eukprot:8804702-Karenia_brevis.AAC.1